jgi:hypothetical protein
VILVKKILLPGSKGSLETGSATSKLQEMGKMPCHLLKVHLSQRELTGEEKQWEICLGVMRKEN